MYTAPLNLVDKAVRGIRRILCWGLNGSGPSTAVAVGRMGVQEEVEAATTALLSARTRLQTDLSFNLRSWSQT